MKYNLYNIKVYVTKHTSTIIMEGSYITTVNWIRATAVTKYFNYLYSTRQNVSIVSYKPPNHTLYNYVVEVDGVIIVHLLYHAFMYMYDMNKWSEIQSRIMMAHDKRIALYILNDEMLLASDDTLTSSLQALPLYIARLDVIAKWEGITEVYDLLRCIFPPSTLHNILLHAELYVNYRRNLYSYESPIPLTYVDFEKIILDPDTYMGNEDTMTVFRSIPIENSLQVDIQRIKQEIRRVRELRTDGSWKKLFIWFMKHISNLIASAHHPALIRELNNAIYEYTMIK